jgi:hypothetical protein
MLRFDDQFPLHRKVGGLTDSAFRMHVEAIFWCARNLTDGFIAQDDLASACRYRKPEGYLAECVKRGAWHQVNDGRISDCPQCVDRYGNTLSGDGWLIHGYLDWQLPRSKVLKIRLARQKAGRLGGKRSGEVRSGFASANSEDLLHKPRPKKTQAKKGVEAAAKQTVKQQGSTQVEPPIPSPSKEGNRGSRAAPLGAPLAPPDPPAAPPVVFKPPPDLLADTRTKLRAASAKLNAPKGGINGSPFQALMALPVDPPDTLEAT